MLGLDLEDQDGILMAATVYNIHSSYKLFIVRKLLKILKKRIYGLYHLKSFMRNLIKEIRISLIFYGRFLNSFKM